MYTFLLCNKIVLTGPSAQMIETFRWFVDSDLKGVICLLKVRCVKKMALDINSVLKHISTYLRYNDSNFVSLRPENNQILI